MTFDEGLDLDKTRDRSLLRHTPDAARLSGDLDALVGRRRTVRAPQGAGHDVPRLVAMVEAAAADRVPLVDVPSPTVRRRAPRRIDWLTVASAAAAVIAVSVASSFTAVQMANANPVGDAVVLLEADQEALESAEQGLVAMRTRLQEQADAGRAGVTAVTTALASLVPGDGESPFVAPAAVDAAKAAAAQYAAALDALVLPAALPDWEEPDIDRDSLASVGTAIDEVQGRAGEVDQAAAQLRLLRAEADAAADTFSTGLAAFASAVAAEVPAVLDDAPSADQALRDAVQTTAAAIGEVDLTTPAGAAALVAYRDAVRAVRADQQRVEDEAAEADQQGWWPGDGGGEQETPTPTEPVEGDPGSDPGTDPGTGEPADPGGETGTEPDPGNSGG